MTTKEKMAYIFKAIERSGVSISDLQKITNISRNTLHAWKKGGNVADMLRFSIMLKVAANLNIACDEKKLPLQNPLKSDERLRLLRKLIANAATKRVE